MSYPLPSQAPAPDLNYRQKTEDEDVVEGSSSTVAENRQMMNAAVETWIWQKTYYFESSL